MGLPMPVSTRWSDTSPEAMKVFIELHRQMSPAHKAARVLELSRMVLALAETGVRRRYPQAGEREVFLRTAALHLPRNLMIRAYGWHPDLGPPPTP